MPLSSDSNQVRSHKERQLGADPSHEELLAETIVVPDNGGNVIHADHARPFGPGPFPWVALLHHGPGWDS